LAVAGDCVVEDDRVLAWGRRAGRADSVHALAGVRIAGVLSSLTLALLVLLALAFGHHVYHDHVASLPWFQQWASAGLVGPSDGLWPAATLSWVQTLAVGGQLVLAAFVLWWPAAHDAAPESPVSGEVG